MFIERVCSACRWAPSRHSELTPPSPFGVLFFSALLASCASRLQELMASPEASPYYFRLFTGEIIGLFPDGSFAVDGNDCSGEVYTGVGDCE